MRFFVLIFLFCERNANSERIQKKKKRLDTINGEIMLNFVKFKRNYKEVFVSNFKCMSTLLLSTFHELELY